MRDETTQDQPLLPHPAPAPISNPAPVGHDSNPAPSDSPHPSSRLTTWVLATVLGLSPFYGIGQWDVIPVTFAGFSFRWGGLASVAFAALALGLLALSFWDARKDAWTELGWTQQFRRTAIGLLWAWVAWLFVRTTQVDNFTLRSWVNAVAFAALAHWTLIEASQPWARAWGRTFPIFALAIAVVIMGPFLFPGYEPEYIHVTGTLYRFSGFAGNSFVTAHASGLLIMGATIWLLSEQSSGRLRKPLFWSCVALALFGCVITTSRTAILVSMAFLSISAIWGITRTRASASTRKTLWIAFALAAIMNLHPNILTKYGFRISYGGFLDNLKWKWSQSFESPGPLHRLDVLVNSNGRSFAFRKLFKENDENPTPVSWAGAGTGASSRYLRKFIGETQEPHNEFVRFIYDLGIFGLGLLVAALGFYFLSLRSVLARASVFCLLLWCATENYLHYPSFGFGPILIMLAMALSLTKPSRWRTGISSNRQSLPA